MFGAPECLGVGAMGQVTGSSFNGPANVTFGPCAGRHRVHKLFGLKLPPFSSLNGHG